MKTLPRKFMMLDFPNLSPDEKVDRFVKIHLDTYDLPGIDRSHAEMMILCGMHAMAIILGETFRSNPEKLVNEIEDFSGACIDRFIKIKVRESEK